MFSLNEKCEVYSKSNKRWIEGSITELNDSTLTVLYEVTDGQYKGHHFRKRLYKISSDIRKISKHKPCFENGKIEFKRDIKSSFDIYHIELPEIFEDANESLDIIVGKDKKWKDKEQYCNGWLENEMMSDEAIDVRNELMLQWCNCQKEVKQTIKSKEEVVIEKRKKISRVSPSTYREFVGTSPYKEFIYNRQMLDNTIEEHYTSPKIRRCGSPDSITGWYGDGRNEGY